LINNVEHGAQAAGHVNAGPADKGTRPLIPLGNQVGQDHRPTVFERHPRLGASAAVLACFDYHRG
jgi:hypothetical protein